MRMPKTGTPIHSSAWRSTFAIAIVLVTFLLLSANRVFARPQSEGAPGLLVTPSAVVLLVGENTSLSAVDETGRPVSNVHWSINPSIADLNEENGDLFLEGKQSGHAVLTAVADNQIATAVVSIVSGNKLPPATVRWSLQPMPGFETLLVMQAVPTGRGPSFYSIEWSNSTNAIVRALGESGQQMWMTHLASSASPLTLKHSLPAPGQVFQNEAIVSDHSMFIIGEKSAFALNNATDPSSYGLPLDGKSILLRASGEDSGGIILLERGRFRDFLVDLNPADGSELWRYRSEGRLTKNWTANWKGDVGIVEALSKPASSALLFSMLRRAKFDFGYRFQFHRAQSTGTSALIRSATF
jgi:outer membrane protein assembly factor BamB